MLYFSQDPLVSLSYMEREKRAYPFSITLQAKCKPKRHKNKVGFPSFPISLGF